MLKSLAMFIAVLVALTAIQALAAPIVTGDLMELIEPERAAYLRDSVCTQISSFDRTGGNDDGFSGTYSFIRKEGDNLVIFDSQGPGCIYRLWSANPSRGWVKFYFDGEETPRLQFDHFEDMFTNVKYPFVPPLSQHFLGGWASYVPLPFAKSLKIVAQGPVYFLQMTWHKFSSAEGVKTFDPNFSAQERVKLLKVKQAWLKPGAPPAPYPAAAETMTVNVTAKPNSTTTLAKLSGAGMIRAIRVHADSQDLKFLRKSLLLVNVDGRKSPNVYSPLGDFFLDPFGAGRSQSMIAGKATDTTTPRSGRSMTGKPEDFYYSYWVMPYASGATIAVRNDSRLPVQLNCEVVYEPVKKLLVDMGRFFAWWHRQSPTIEGQLFPILDAKGRGQWCGVSHAMQGGGQGLGFLEGDEMAWIDGRDNTYYNGTGTEDYFNGGWYFGDVGSAPMYGCGMLEGSGRAHAYRIQLTDLVPFQQTVRIGIEHGHANSVPADYAGVSFWYAAPGTTHGFKPVDVLARLDRPAPEPSVIEAESLFDPKGGGKVVDDSDQPFYLSSGKGVATTGSLTLNIDLPDAEEYDVDLGLVKGPSMGIAEVAVDGQTIGKPIDTYSEKVQTRGRVAVTGMPELAKGVHKLTVKSVGKNEKSTGAGVLVDFLTLHSGRVIEGESMELGKATGGDAGRQGLDGFSNGAHLFFRGTKAGASLDLGFSVRKTRKYPVSVWLTKAADYGIVQVKIDGQAVGQPFDGYNNGVTRELVKLGEMQLSEGPHTITLEVAGKNEKSSDYFAGLDALVLK